jgi:hypothetical protein
MSPDPTVYAARKIITMNPARPTATHVAVRDGRILGVGSAGRTARLGPAHAGRALRRPGADARPGRRPQPPDGRHAVALRLLRLLRRRRPRRPRRGRARQVARRGGRGAGRRGRGRPTARWSAGASTRSTSAAAAARRADLDRVSTTRPVGVMHASGHILNVNTVALQRAGCLRPGIDHPAFPLGADGLPTGELKGPEAMMPALDHVGLDRSSCRATKWGIRAFGRWRARRRHHRHRPGGHAGRRRARHAAARDRRGRLPGAPGAAAALIGMTPGAGGGSVPWRCAAAAPSSCAWAASRSWPTARSRASRRGCAGRATSTARPTACGTPRPRPCARPTSWRCAPAVPVHTHTNGDEATELALDCMEQALAAAPARRPPLHAAALPAGRRGAVPPHEGAGRVRQPVRQPPLLLGRPAPHGDRGPRARRTHERLPPPRCDAGVPLAIHSDAPITPLAPLFTAWCAVNRLTASGHVLGEAERIGVPEALHAITLGAACHAAPGRRDRLASNAASAPTSACWTTTRWPCPRGAEGPARLGHGAGRARVPGAA